MELVVLNKQWMYSFPFVALTFFFSPIEDIKCLLLFFYTKPCWAECELIYPRTINTQHNSGGLPRHKKRCQFIRRVGRSKTNVSQHLVTTMGGAYIPPMNERLRMGGVTHNATTALLLLLPLLTTGMGELVIDMFNYFRHFVGLVVTVSWSSSNRDVSGKHRQEHFTA